MYKFMFIEIFVQNEFRITLKIVYLGIKAGMIFVKPVLASLGILRIFTKINRQTTFFLFKLEIFKTKLKVY